MAEQNLITTEVLSKAQIRETEFALNFVDDLRKFTEALGVTRKVAKQAGYQLKTYKAKGTLGSVNVDEGETIPLSKYTIEEIPYKEITFQKRAKATTAEAIIGVGYDQAVTMTTAEMQKDVAKTIRKSFYDFLATGTGVASGKGLQGALADTWGQLQVLFEDTDANAVYFVNPLDIASYLGSAAITTQTAFGMSYIENFLGLGTVIVASDVPQGTVYATPKENIVMYYIPVNGADLGEVFNFTTDPTGYIGVHEEPDYTNMTSRDTLVWGIELFAEKIDGVVVGTITE